MSDRRTLTYRKAKNRRERLAAAVASTEDDIFEVADGRVVVTGVVNGERILLGWLDPLLLYTKNDDWVVALDRIRFGQHREKPTSRVHNRREYI